MPKRKPRSYQPADQAFRAEIAESQRQRHDAWINREPGDGLAIAEVVDPETGELRYDRVQPNFHHAAPSTLRLPLPPSKRVSRA